jgi:hypothetical protein
MKYVLFLLLASNAFAQVQSAAVTRFTYALDGLQTAYSGKTIDATLAGSGQNDVPGVDESPRQLLFRLESLFRLYGNSYPQLSTQFLSSVKGLEDGIGHYGDTQDFLQEAQQGEANDAAYIQKMTDQNTAALANMQTLLQSWASPTNSPMADNIRAAVTPIFATITPDQDRAALVSEILILLNLLETKKFDMTKLESGIHELRRQARWLEYYTYAIGGLFIWDTTGAQAQCPADATAAGFGSISLDGYENVTPIAPVDNPCYIAACLGAKVSDIQNNLAGIKETAVLGDASQEKDLEYASPEVTQQATALYNTLLGVGGGPKIIDELKTQFQACLVANPVTPPTPAPVASPAPAQP